MAQNNDKRSYLVVDSRHTPLARAVLESPTDAASWQICVLDGGVEKVVDHEVLQLVSIDERQPSLEGRIIGRKEDRLVLEPLGKLMADVRENLRMPVHFHSYIYPLTGMWRGRRAVEGHDMSCGGIAFFSDEPLLDGEQVEIVVPVNKEPLVLRAEVVRPRLAARQTPLYAARFVDLVHDEETLVREAVFGLQLQARESGKGAVVS